MSKNRMVNTKFWSDGFIVDNCNALDRYLFLYLLTNEKTNIVGVYELSLRTAAFETGIDKDDLQKMLARLSPKIEYFDGWVYIRRFVDHQQINPNIEKGMMREVFALPVNVIEKVISLGIESPRLSKAFQSLSNALKGSVKPKLEPNLNLNLTKLETKPLDSSSELLAPADKPAAPKISSKDIDGMFEYWEKQVGYKLTMNKTARSHASELLKNRTKQEIAEKIQAVAAGVNDQYAPRVSNFKELNSKWDKVNDWVNRTGRQFRQVQVEVI